MKKEDAMSMLIGIEKTLGYANITKEPLKIAIEALDKQISRPVIPNKRIAELCKCPICKTELCRDDKDLHYCPTCGQALELS